MRAITGIALVVSGCHAGEEMEGLEGSNKEGTVSFSEQLRTGML